MLGWWTFSGAQLPLKVFTGALLPPHSPPLLHPCILLWVAALSTGNGFGHCWGRSVEFCVAVGHVIRLLTCSSTLWFFFTLYNYTYLLGERHWLPIEPVILPTSLICWLNSVSTLAPTVYMNVLPLCAQNPPLKTSWPDLSSASALCLIPRNADVLQIFSDHVLPVFLRSTGPSKSYYCMTYFRCLSPAIVSAVV